MRFWLRCIYIVMLLESDRREMANFAEMILVDPHYLMGGPA